MNAVECVLNIKASTTIAQTPASYSFDFDYRYLPLRVVSFKREEEWKKGMIIAQ